MNYKKMREEYVKDLSESMQKAYRLIFTKADDYTKRTNLILEEFTEEEFVTFVKEELIAKSANSSNVRVNLIKTYANHIGKDFVKLTRTDVVKMVEEHLKENNIENEAEIKYISWKELLGNLNRISNDIDKAILVLLRLGVGGNKFVELSQLETENIDLENRKIYLKDRTININEDLVDILEQGIKQRTYHTIMHQSDAEPKVSEYDFNMKCSYVVKPKPIVRNNDGMNCLKFSGITSKLFRITCELGLDITAMNLLQSYAIDELIKEEDRLGRRLSVNQTERFFEKRGIKRSATDIITLAKQVRKRNKK